MRLSVPVQLATIDYAGPGAALGPPIQHPGMYLRCVADRRRRRWPQVLWATALLSLTALGAVAVGVRHFNWFAVP